MSDSIQSPGTTGQAAAAVFTEAPTQPTQVTQAPTQVPTPAPVTPSPAPTPTPSPGLTRDDIQELVNSVTQASAPRQQEAPLTQAEIDQALRVFRPTAKQVSSILAGGEEAVIALNEIVNGTATHATTVAQLQLQSAMQQLESRLNPLQSYVQERQAEQLKQEFLESNPDLKGYEPLLMSVRDQMVREGLKFRDKKTAFAEVAKRAKDVINKLPGVGSPAPAQGQQTSAPHQMSTLTGGGQGSTGTTSQAPTHKSKGLSVFD